MEHSPFIRVLDHSHVDHMLASIYHEQKTSASLTLSASSVVR